tara:strand:- start:1359 stop:1706 length:348 start_codon:yes stop_codon:yes gene_type:complete
MKWGKIKHIPYKNLHHKHQGEGTKMYSFVYRNYLLDCNKEALLLPDEFAPALVGVAHQRNKSLAIYDSVKVIKCLMNNEKMTEEEARKHFELNIKKSDQGENTPLFLDHIHDILL